MRAVRETALQEDDMTWVIAAVMAATFVAIVVLVERAVCGARHCPRASDRALTDAWWSVR